MEDGCAVGARRIIDVLSEYSRFITFQNKITVTHQAFRPTEGLSRVARPRKKTVKTKIFPKTCTIAAWRSSLYDFSVSKNEIYFYVWNDSIIMTKTWLFWVMYNRLRLKNPRVYSHRVQICISTDKPSDRMKLCTFSQILFNSIQFNFVIHQLSVSIFLNHSKFCLPEDSQCSVCRPPRLSFFIFCVFLFMFLVFVVFFIRLSQNDILAPAVQISKIYAPYLCIYTYTECTYIHVDIRTPCCTSVTVQSTAFVSPFRHYRSTLIITA